MQEFNGNLYQTSETRGGFSNKIHYNKIVFGESQLMFIKKVNKI